MDISNQISISVNAGNLHNSIYALFKVRELLLKSKDFINNLGESYEGKLPETPDHLQTLLSACEACSPSGMVHMPLAIAKKTILFGILLKEEQKALYNEYLAYWNSNATDENEEFKLLYRRLREYENIILDAGVEQIRVVNF